MLAVYHYSSYTHLGETWLKGYEHVANERIEAKHSSNKARNESLKLALNGGGYGKTNSSFSWMYDPLTNNI